MQSEHRAGDTLAPPSQLQQGDQVSTPKSQEEQHSLGKQPDRPANDLECAVIDLENDKQVACRPPVQGGQTLGVRVSGPMGPSAQSLDRRSQLARPASTTQFMRLSPTLAAGKVLNVSVQSMDQPSSHRQAFTPSL